MRQKSGPYYSAIFAILLLANFGSNVCAQPTTFQATSLPGNVLDERQAYWTDDFVDAEASVVLATDYDWEGDPGIELMQVVSPGPPGPVSRQPARVAQRSPRAQAHGS